ncbi:hypothetical protein Tco_1097495 [Tanacetum coccineum]
MSVDSVVTYTMFTLRHDHGVSHLRILTRRLPDSYWSRHHVLQSMYLILWSWRIMYQCIARCTRPGCEVGESYAAAARQPGPTMARRVDCSSVDTVETRERERLAYEQESIENRQALAMFEAYSRALEAWISALEAGARDETLEDTGSSA